MSLRNCCDNKWNQKCDKVHCIEIILSVLRILEVCFVLWLGKKVLMTIVKLLRIYMRHQSPHNPSSLVTFDNISWPLPSHSS